MATLTENIFKTLKRLFSNDIVVRRVGDKKFKVIDTYNTQAIGMLATNYLNRNYNILRYNTTNYGYNQNLSILSQRLMIFREYELMDQDPIIASALDLYAEEATVKNEFGDILTVKSDDREIKEVLDNLFYDILNIDFNLLHWTRNLVKYGDMFMKLDLAEKIGIVGVIPISPYVIERYEGLNPENPYEVKYKIDGPIFQGMYENYEIAHFRMLSDSNFLPYGKSMIEAARRIWKQLTLMEDAMLIHRIMRAPQKRVFNIDVGNIAPNEVPAYIEKIANQTKKVPYIDENTGDYNLKYNIQNITEDFFIPNRGGESSTKIDTLQGLEYNAIEDVEYLRNKMMSALRIPKAFLGYEEAIGAKATLSQEDIRFARTIERIQKIIAAELENLARIHLFMQGYKDEDLMNFELYLSSPSTIYEQEKLQIMQSKLDVAQKAKEQNILGSDFIYKEIFKLSDDEKDKNKNTIIEDAKFDYRIEQIKTQGNDPAKTGQHVSNSGTVRGVDEPDRIDVIGNEVTNNQDNSSQQNKMGRPTENNSTYGTDEHILGRDPVGRISMNKSIGLSKSDKSSGLNFKGKSPFALETKNKLYNISKKYIIKDKKVSNILKENKLDNLLNGSIKKILDNDDK